MRRPLNVGQQPLAEIEACGSTVRNYLSTAIAKTSTRNRLEALQVADERGWL